MRFSDYLRLEGTCALVLGVFLVALAAVFGGWHGPAWEAPVLVAIIGPLAVPAARAATRSALRQSATRPIRMTRHAVRRQTLSETGLWALAVAVWIVVTGRDAELIAATGVATVVFGAVRRRAAVPTDALVERRRYLIGATVTLGHD